MTGHHQDNEQPYESVGLWVNMGRAADNVGQVQLNAVNMAAGERAAAAGRRATLLQGAADAGRPAPGTCPSHTGSSCHSHPVRAPVTVPVRAVTVPVTGFGPGLEIKTAAPASGPPSSTNNTENSDHTATVYHTGQLQPCSPTTTRSLTADNVLLHNCVQQQMNHELYRADRANWARHSGTCDRLPDPPTSSSAATQSRASALSSSYEDLAARLDYDLVQRADAAGHGDDAVSPAPDTDRCVAHAGGQFADFVAGPHHFGPLRFDV